MSEVVLLTTITAIVLGLIVVIGALTVGMVRQILERRRAPAIERARRAVVATVSTGEGEIEAVAAVSALRLRNAIALLLQLALSVAGSSQQALAAIAVDAGVLDGAREDLESNWWWRRLHAARLLAALGPPSPAYRPLLEDPAPEVRAQAATWSAMHPDEGAIQRLGAMLGDDDGLCRFAAQSALVKVGERAVPEVDRLLASDDDAVVNRALQVGAVIGDARLVPRLLDLVDSPSARTRELCAMALGRTGEPETEAALTAMLTDEEPTVRRASVKALAALGCWPAASAIERLLDDPAIDVRREAGGALAEVGSVGDLLLRSSARRTDDMGLAARHVLTLEALRAREVPA